MEVKNVLVVDSADLNRLSTKAGTRQVIQAIRENYAMEAFDGIVLKTSIDYHYFPKILRRDIEPCYWVYANDEVLVGLKGRKGSA